MCSDHESHRLLNSPKYVRVVRIKEARGGLTVYGNVRICHPGFDVFRFIPRWLIGEYMFSIFPTILLFMFFTF